MARFTLIRLDDWCGLYDGDKLVYEHHDIEPEHIFDLCGIDAESEWSDENFDDLAPWGGRMPASLADWRKAELALKWKT
jgi:hypothetical protein